MIENIGVRNDSTPFGLNIQKDRAAIELDGEYSESGFWQGQGLGTQFWTCYLRDSYLEVK